jgi:hypothetical protein
MRASTFTGIGGALPIRREDERGASFAYRAVLHESPDILSSKIGEYRSGN